MDGLMMDRPLLVKQIAERAEAVFGAPRGGRADPGGRRALDLRAGRRAGSAPGQRARRARSGARRSGRELRLELASPPGALPRGAEHGGRPAHAQHPAVRGRPPLHRRARGRPRDLPRRLAGVGDAAVRGHRPRGPDAGRSRRAPGALDYEELVASGDPAFELPELDENTAAAMCYTSGTTGRPKGVLYSHRSIVLHTLGAALPDSMGIREADSVMPVVPMFHAMAWGIPYIATMLGARQVLPGPDLTPQGLADLIAAEGVTWSAGVPTIWNGFLELDPPPDLSSVRELKAGGSAVPEPLIRAFEERFGVPLVQGWGMTETSPLAAASRLPAGVELSDDEAYALRASQGRVLPLVEFRIDRGLGRRATGPRPVDRARLLPGPERRREVHRRRLAPHRRRRRARARCVHQARRSHQGPGQVGRRVDLLGRARERDHGPPRRGRGRRDRRSRRALGRAAVRLRGPPRRPRRRRRTASGRTSASGSPSGGSRSASSSSTRCPRPRSASSTRSSCAPGSRPARRRSAPSRADLRHAASVPDPHSSPHAWRARARVR